VNYLDSSGLGMIAGLVVSAKKSGCKLRFVNLAPRVKEIFTMTRLMEAWEGSDFRWLL
jgi:anti-anti-sigma factor